MINNMIIAINQSMIQLQVTPPKLRFVYLEPVELSVCCKALPEGEIHRVNGQAYGRCSRCKNWEKFNKVQ